MVRSHHNHAWREPQEERDLWVMGKGATPAIPDQWGFVGDSMGDDAVILDRVETPEGRSSLQSPVEAADLAVGRRSAGLPARRWTPGA
jgi:tRNA-splicing ligase RtcB